jgi:hypothetical protein
MFARFRSNSRDRDADAARLDRIRDSIDEAQASARRELAGLERRVEAARQRAAFMPEAQDGNTGGNLEEVERTILRGEARVKELKTQLGVFEDMLLRLEALTLDETQT